MGQKTAVSGAPSATNVKTAHAAGAYSHSMRLRDIKWGAAIVGMLLVEVAQIAAAIAWVAFYSYVVHPGEAPAFYQRYAEVASPWVSVVAGPPIFYLICRRLVSRSPARAWPTAMALFGFFILVDLTLVFSAGIPSSRLAGFLCASYLLKFLACHFAGRRAALISVAEPA